MNAYWLAQLLVHGIPPIVTNGRVSVVHFQTERLGWNTDDFLVEVDVGHGPSRRLAGQVKRSFTVSASDEECIKAISDFWKDHKSRAAFDATRDCFVLVVPRGSKVLLDHLSSLLDAARAANSADDFDARLGVNGLLHATARKYVEELRTIVMGCAEAPPQAADFWEFLRSIHLLVLDLGTSTAQAESNVRTLLALTARSPDQVIAAAASWNALVVLASGAMPQARTFKRGDLPNDLTALHEAIGANARETLTALEQHSEVVRDGICTTLGSALHLPRPELSVEVHRGLAGARVVLISGPSGSGKSAVAADYIASMKGTFCFSFRAEEFAHPHIDDSLARAQVPANAKTLRALMATQGRLIVHVESVERLLEASQRKAFGDLLTLVKGEPNWQLLLTCRDYSLDLVRSAFLMPTRVEHAVVEVPPLDDSSLNLVSTAFEQLKIPLGDPALKALLRNPYYLDAALRVDWSGGTSLPTGVRELRSRFWRDVIRVDQDRTAGMPQRRHNAFVEVALRRARELRAWVCCKDLDQDALFALQRDSLVAQSKESPGSWAPAHDVLEDWAILTALDEVYAEEEGSVQRVANIVGEHPALRRTLRRWFGEVQPQRDGVNHAFEMALDGRGLAPWLRDDILAALLGGGGATELLSRHAEALFRDGCALLTRIIHLLRVACQRTPAWAAGLNFNILEPTGTSWAALAEIVAANVQRLSPREMPLVLGFIEDWAEGVTMRHPHPPGEAAVVSIAHVLAHHFDDYCTQDQQRRVFRVIAKCPSADPDGIRRLLGLGDEGTKQDRDSEMLSREFREQVLAEQHGHFIAAQQPDLVIEACRSFFLLDEKVDDDDAYGRHPSNLEAIFGLDPSSKYAFSTASAYRGPYLTLLRRHFWKGLEFVVEVADHCCDWYEAERSGTLEPLVQVVLTRPDGAILKHRSTERFYKLYRGEMAIGPSWLKTLLMATEHVLLERAASNPVVLDDYLLWLLSMTNCAAIAGVVASVAVANPKSASRTVLTLISSREYIILDRARMHNESLLLSEVFDAFPYPKQGVFVEERKNSNQLPHRKHDLEWAALTLQLGPSAPQVHAIIDMHASRLPPLDAQSLEDKLLRRALHRMDLRNYTPEERSPSPVDVSDVPNADREDGVVGGREPLASASENGTTRSIVLVPKELAPDLAAESREVLEEINLRYEPWELRMWAKKAYEGSSEVDPEEWRARLTQVAGQKPDPSHMPPETGLHFVAALCLRDHWPDMDESQRSWCLDVVNSVVEASDWDGSGYDPAPTLLPEASGACASALVFHLFHRHHSPASGRTESTLLVALTHPNLRMRWHAAHAIAQHLTESRRELAWLCTRVVAFHATLTEKLLRGRSYRMMGAQRWRRLHRSIASRVRRRFLPSVLREAPSRLDVPRAEPDDALTQLELGSWHGADAAALSLGMLAGLANDLDAVAVHAHVAQALVEWWDQDARERSSPPGERRSVEAMRDIPILISRFSHSCSPDMAVEVLRPILGAVDAHPDKVEALLTEFIFEEDRVRSTNTFWNIWRCFAARIEAAEWLPRVDDPHHCAASLVRAIFLCSSRKDDARHWPPLEGHAHLLGELLVRLPASPLALESYACFLYRVGRGSLPSAFVTLAEYVKRDPVALLSVSNTVFVLAEVLREWVYGHSIELKRDRQLRESVLSLLDHLVEAGSSASFRMRDDFVTPLRES